MTLAALLEPAAAVLAGPAQHPWAATLAGVLLVASLGTAGAQDAGFPVRRGGAPFDALLDATNGAWEDAAAITWGTAPYPTEFRALRTADGLALRFHAVDDAPWYTLTERDDPIWNEEVVEIFIDPDGDGHNYVEIEINPANVVCDLQIFATAPALSSDIDWNFAGVETRVSRVDDGWIATAILPWEGFAALRDTAVRLPPTAGDAWSFNVFRIKRPGGAAEPERDVLYAPWSPTPSLSFHAPSAFRPLRFVE
ncbi:MAG: carbohydrate-binding family 9-like protein [Acidobacteriota bacterium]